MRHAELTLKARAISRCLSYNDTNLEAETKFALLELAHRLDIRDIDVHGSGFSIMFVNGLGKTRKATFKEWFLYTVFNVLPVVI